MGGKHQQRPVIGVTGPGKRGKGNWWFFKIVIWFLGAKPIHFIPGKNLTIQDIDALLISGGADIDPERYGREIDSLPSQARKKRSAQLLTWLFYPFIQIYKEAFGVGSSDVNRERDEMEFPLLAEAISGKKPVLGICRGMQLMNVALGGTLYHDINSLGYEVQYKKSVFPRKWIHITAQSLLHDIIGYPKCRINSLHNQGVDRLGQGLEIIAKDENGLTQALEKKGGTFCLGVQWHPEYIPYLKNQRQIFSSFIQAAKRDYQS